MKNRRLLIALLCLFSCFADTHGMGRGRGRGRGMGMRGRGMGMRARGFGGRGFGRGFRGRGFGFRGGFGRRRFGGPGFAFRGGFGRRRGFGFGFGFGLGRRYPYWSRRWWWHPIYRGDRVVYTYPTYVTSRTDDSRLNQDIQEILAHIRFLQERLDSLERRLDDAPQQSRRDDLGEEVQELKENIDRLEQLEQSLEAKLR